MCEFILDNLEILQKQKDANLRFFVDLSEQNAAANLPGSSASANAAERRQLLEQELERRVIEVAELSSKVFELENGSEQVQNGQNERIRELEAQNSHLQRELQQARASAAAATAQVAHKKFVYLILIHS